MDIDIESNFATSFSMSSFSMSNYRQFDGAQYSVLNTDAIDGSAKAREVSFNSNLAFLTLSTVLKKGTENVHLNPFYDPRRSRPASNYPEPSALLMAGASTLIGLSCWLSRRLVQRPGE